MVRRKKISFWATKRSKVPKRICFKTKNGRRVCFTARKTTKKPVKISFWATKKTKRRRR